MSFLSTIGKFDPLLGFLMPAPPKVKNPPPPPPAPEPPPPPPPAPRHENPETAQAADEAARKAVLESERERRKRSNTILTANLEETPAPTRKKTLLGA